MNFYEQYFLTGVTVGLLCGDFIFDVTLYAVKIVASFYQVQYEHIK